MNEDVLGAASPPFEALYAERAAIAIALARAARALGCRVGFRSDPDEPAWPVLYVDLPTGQVSWHLRAKTAEAAGDLGRYPGKWDGHTTEEKYRRLAAWSPS